MILVDSYESNLILNNINGYSNNVIQEFKHVAKNVIPTSYGKYLINTKCGRTLEYLQYYETLTKNEYKLCPVCSMLTKDKSNIKKEPLFTYKK
jgi:hypothetical protein